MGRLPPNFGSGRLGGGDKKSGMSKSGGTGTGSSSFDRAMASKNGVNGTKKMSDMSQSERMQQLMQQKLEQQKAMLMAEKKYNYTPMGAKQEPKEISKSAQMALEIIAQRMAKKEMALVKRAEKQKDNIEIRPAYIGGMVGGRVERNGNITNSAGEVVARIDRKTGDITTTGLFGKKIGTYDPDNSFCMHKLSELMARDAEKKGRKPGNIWGATTDNQSSGGSIWGNAGGNIWSTMGDDTNNGGGGWW